MRFLEEPDTDDEVVQEALEAMHWPSGIHTYSHMPHHATSKCTLLRYSKHQFMLEEQGRAEAAAEQDMHR